MVNEEKTKEDKINEIMESPETVKQIFKYLFSDISGMMEMTSYFKVKKGQEKFFKQLVDNIDCNILCIEKEGKYCLIAPDGSISECHLFDIDGKRFKANPDKMSNTYNLLKSVIDENETIFVQYTIYEKGHKNNPPKSDTGTIIITHNSVTYIEDPNPYL